MLQCLECLVCSLAPPPAKVSGSHQNNLIMRELLIMQEPLSGRSWTSKVFNIVITLDTYQFLYFFINVFCQKQCDQLVNRKKFKL